MTETEIEIAKKITELTSSEVQDLGEESASCLIDEFAGRALVGLAQFAFGVGSDQLIADRAYKLAEAMMTSREKLLTEKPHLFGE